MFDCDKFSKFFFFFHDDILFKKLLYLCGIKHWMSGQSLRIA